MQECEHIAQNQEGARQGPRLRRLPAHRRHLGAPSPVHVCGHVGCCDSSKNKHATKHFHATKHPIVRSLEPGEEWGWCYLDEVMFESLP